MTTKQEDFLDICISTGKYVETGLKLPHNVTIEIESILNKYNDSTAKTKIRRLLKLNKND